jgi:hypothetical protein
MRMASQIGNLDILHSDDAQKTHQTYKPQRGGDALERSHAGGPIRTTHAAVNPVKGRRTHRLVAARGRLISPGVSRLAYGSLAFRSRMVARHTTRRIDDFTHITNELAAQARGVAWFAAENCSD